MPNVLKLTHYSNTDGILVLEPNAGSTSPDGNGAEKKRAALPGFVPRWYAYVNDAKPEYRISGRGYKYETSIWSDLLYDIDADADDYKCAATYSDPNRLEAALKEAGYQGYWSPVHGIAALFGHCLAHQVTHERDLFELKETI